MKKLLLIPAVLASVLAHAGTDTPAEKNEKPPAVECCDETCSAPSPKTVEKAAEETAKPEAQLKKK